MTASKNTVNDDILRGQIPKGSKNKAQIMVELESMTATLFAHRKPFLGQFLQFFVQKYLLIKSLDKW